MPLKPSQIAAASNACRDAMGANAVNTMAETVAPYIGELTGGRIYLRIISNFADKRLIRAKAVFTKETIGGEEVVNGILAAYHFAAGDPYRSYRRYGR